MSRPAALAAAALLFAAAAEAHTAVPATLTLREVSRGAYDVAWQVPVAEGERPELSPMLPSTCLASEDMSEVAGLNAVLVRGIVRCTGPGLDGQVIEIAGLPSSGIDVIARVTFLDGQMVSRVLRAGTSSFRVEHKGGRGTDLSGYGVLGFTHILSGLDHLLFVFGLIFIVSGTGRLLRAVTAFTVAHSVTLILAATGVVVLPTGPVEAVIALSLVFLAVELAHKTRGIDGLTFRNPWVVAFAFGLLHGLGFAGTLTEVGIPRNDIPLALLGFNLGVEAGQVLFIAVTLATFRSWRALTLSRPAWIERAVAYSIGIAASYWFFQRCVTIFSM